MNLADGEDLLQHLVVDRLIKIGVAGVALAALAIGLAMIWWRAGRR